MYMIRTYVSVDLKCFALHISQDLSLDEFHRQLIAKSHDLFPSLIEEELKPYLLRSRATNAYDAVTLLAKSVGVVLAERSGDNCNDDGLVQVALENLFMVSNHSNERLYMYMQRRIRYRSYIQILISQSVSLSPFSNSLSLLPPSSFFSVPPPPPPPPPGV